MKPEFPSKMGLRNSRKHYLSISVLLLSAAVACSDAESAQAQDLLQDFIAAGKPLVNLRLRFEDLDQANKPNNAEATTLRPRLGYQTGTFLGFSALGEIDLVQHLGAKHFNDSINGLAGYPTIADPDLATVNRLQLSYGARLVSATQSTAPPDLTFTVGRQRILFGDSRFIGNADWRQHEQTFDALSVSDTSLPATTLTYVYVARVNRVFGPNSPAGDFNSHSHLFNVVYGGLLPALKLEGYSYLLDFREAPTLSTATYGLRGEGAFDLAPGLTARINGAYANQTARANNPLHLDLSYYLGEAGFAYKGFTGLVGYKVLQGNGTMAFQTPLASLHAFQGWAETFLTKPPNGLEDFYIKTGYGLGAAPFFARVSGNLIYHDFSAEHVRADYGNEWDAQLEGQVDSHWVLDAAYADYSGAGPFPDKKVFWLYATYRY